MLPRIPYKLKMNDISGLTITNFYNIVIFLRDYSDLFYRKSHKAKLEKAFKKLSKYIFYG